MADDADLEERVLEMARDEVADDNPVPMQQEHKQGEGKRHEQAAAQGEQSQDPAPPIAEPLRSSLQRVQRALETYRAPLDDAKQREHEQRAPMREAKEREHKQLMMGDPIAPGGNNDGGPARGDSGSVPAASGLDRERIDREYQEALKRRKCFDSFMHLLVGKRHQISKADEWQRGHGGNVIYNEDRDNLTYPVDFQSDKSFLSTWETHINPSYRSSIDQAMTWIKTATNRTVNLLDEICDDGERRSNFATLCHGLYWKERRVSRPGNWEQDLTWKMERDTFKGLARYYCKKWPGIEGW